ncbi:hypothetical protein [Plantactinospora sp. DSM 117369]
MGQRITRAKRKIADVGIPYRIPADDELGERLAEVLAVVYLLFRGVPAERRQPRAGPLDGYHLPHATRAELLRDLGRPDEARAADERALALTANPAEQSLLRQRLTWA